MKLITHMKSNYTNILTRCGFIKMNRSYQCCLCA